MSVLQDMTKGILDTKAAKASKLTPVAGETTTTVADMAKALAIPDIPEVFLTNEAVTDIARTLRKQAGILVEVADSLDKRTGVPSERFDAHAAKDEAVNTQKAAEKAADEKAKTTESGTVLTPEAQKLVDHMSSLKADAKAEAFAAADDGAEEPAPVAAASGWQCPTHGGTVKQLTSGKGRVYMACTQCDKFER